MRERQWKKDFKGKTSKAQPTLRPPSCKPVYQN
jgi:hypothetical protein